MHTQDYLNEAALRVLQDLYQQGAADDLSLCARLRKTSLGRSVIIAGRKELSRKKLVKRQNPQSPVFVLTVAGYELAKGTSRLKRVDGKPVDVLDTVALADTPLKEYRRRRVCQLIRNCLTAHGVYAAGLAREHQTEDIKNNSYGAVVASLVRARILEPTGNVMQVKDFKNRHGLTLGKVYRLVEGRHISEVV